MFFAFAFHSLGGAVTVFFSFGGGLLVLVFLTLVFLFLVLLLLLVTRRLFGWSGICRGEPAL